MQTQGAKKMQISGNKGSGSFDKFREFSGRFDTLLEFLKKFPGVQSQPSLIFESKKQRNVNLPPLPAAAALQASPSQSDTERELKILRVVEPRFSGFDETKLREGKRDRCMQEIFLRDNKIALAKLPLDDYEQETQKKHLHSAKKDAR